MTVTRLTQNGNCLALKQTGEKMQQTLKMNTFSHLVHLKVRVAKWTSWMCLVKLHFLVSPWNKGNVDKKLTDQSVQDCKIWVVKYDGKSLIKKKRKEKDRYQLAVVMFTVLTLPQSLHLKNLLRTVAPFVLGIVNQMKIRSIKTRLKCD